jgi:diguanylate cyclase (GGDEF)-like protein/PAS domain S-box-containing protein
MQNKVTMPRSKVFKFKRDFFKTLVGHCPDAIIGANRAGIITIFNQAAEALTGWTAKEVMGKMHVSELYHPPVVARQIKKSIYKADKDGVGCVKNLEVKLKTREGHIVPIMLSAVLLKDNQTEVGSVGFFHDLTRTKKLEEISITDNLTKLYNRYYFHAILALELGRSERYVRPLSLVYFDLDNFKPFNDRFGHPEGDHMLRLVGLCCRMVLRTQDYAFRVGGDEFSLLLVETELVDGVQVAERFRMTFNEHWNQSMPPAGKKLKPVTLSLGVAEYQRGNGSDEMAESGEYLIKRADMAMYEAKRAGGNRTVRARSFIGEYM